MRSEADSILRSRPPGGLAREDGRAAHRVAAHTYNEAFRLMAHHPRPGRAAAAAVRRRRLRPPVQDQRQGGVRRRRVAMAPGLRHLGARRRHAGAAGDEHRDLPRRGDADQRPADADPEEPQGTARSAGHDKSTTSYPLWTLDKETVTRLCAEAAPPGGVGIVAPTGKPGSVLMFHGNLVHASPPNITPYPRKIVYLTLCAVSNHITKFTRAGMDRAPRLHADRAGGGRRPAGICARAPRRGGSNLANEAASPVARAHGNPCWPADALWQQSSHLPP